MREGSTRKLLFSPEFQLFSPDFLKEEIENNLLVIVKKNPRENITELKTLIFKRINFISINQLKPFITAAQSICHEDKDLLYLTAALYIGADIWTHDKGFQNQNRIKIISTNQLLDQ